MLKMSRERFSGLRAVLIPGNLCAYRLYEMSCLSGNQELGNPRFASSDVARIAFTHKLSGV